MDKPFYQSDDRIYRQISIDTSTLGDPNPTFIHEFYGVKAHPGVNAEDILDEVRKIEDSVERGDWFDDKRGILTTTLTEYEKLVVAFTYSGFVEVSERYKNLGLKLKRERYSALANDLIRIRDAK